MSACPDLQFEHVVIVPHFAQVGCALCLDLKRPLPFGSPCTFQTVPFFLLCGFSASDMLCIFS